MPESVQADNLYSPPEAELHAADEAPTGELDLEDLRTFVGPQKADYYLTAWASDLKGQGGGPPFNWAAFFLSGLWIAYRKMYRVACILFGIILAESLLEEWFFVYVLGKDGPPAVAENALNLIIAIFCGIMGNRWYLSHAKREVLAARAGGLRGEELSQTLAKRGGVSLGSSLGFLVVFVVAVAGGSFLLDAAYSAPSPTYIEINDHDDITYLNGATEEDARVLGELLTKYNIFGGDGGSVKIERPPQGPAISFVLQEDAWNDTEVVNYWRMVGEFLADDHFGRPLSIQLCDEYFEVKESLLVPEVEIDG